MKLLTDEKSNTKTRKSGGMGYESKIMHLAPAMESGHEVCASRSTGCTTACLFSAGRGKMNTVKKARIARTKMFFADRNGFKKQLYKELTAFVRRCNKMNNVPVARLNGTSDILWEVIFPEMFDDFPDIKYMDYTKHVKRCKDGWSLPKNYHLTFSRSESNEKDCLEILEAAKVNVAAVFSSKNPPEEWRGFKTFDADSHDLRFLDPGPGQVGALYAKGDAKKDTSGFVIQV